MLNPKNEGRKLAHIEQIAWVKPIKDADNIEKVGVLGWVLIAKKGEFKEGDLCCFFEIDSKLPEKEWSKFLEPKKYKVKTYKLGKFEKETGGVISQGLALPIDSIEELNGKTFNIGDDVTDLLGVKYSVVEDNYRKSTSVNPNKKYINMMNRHSRLARSKFGRFCMKHNFTKKLLYLFLGRTKKDVEKSFPKQFEFIHVTDETRVEALDQDWLFSYKEPLIQTLKVDGTSSTYILERKPRNKYEFYVCSRNVRQLTPDQKCYHDDNVYWNMAFKYDIEKFLQKQLEHDPELKYVCLQGETAGPSIQGNPHKLSEQQLFGFNYIDSKKGRWNSIEAANLCAKYGIQWVPILNENYCLPNTMEELKLQADGNCDILGSSGLREGFVYRSKDAKISFKNVSRKYLLKHEG